MNEGELQPKLHPQFTADPFVLGIGDFSAQHRPLSPRKTANASSRRCNGTKRWSW